MERERKNIHIKKENTYGLETVLVYLKSTCITHGNNPMTLFRIRTLFLKISVFFGKGEKGNKPYILYLHLVRHHLKHFTWSLIFTSYKYALYRSDLKMTLNII